VELNQTISELQEEMKLLKGEIKSVLTEIRTAVLNADNPFTLDASLAAVPPPPLPEPAPPAVEHDGPRFSVPATPPDDAPAAAEPAAPAPAPQPVAAQPVAAQPAPAPAPPPIEPVQQASDWSLLTVAGLMLWAEDAVATLGTERLRMVVELAAYASLLPPGARDVLVRVAELAPKKDVNEEPASVIDCVVVLHQLEAILHGDQGMPLPRRREGRLNRAA
jgi:hypothetical protein